MKKYRTQILYIASILLIVLMHTILLDKIPRGLNADEVGSAFDAYSLGHFGVDRWIKSWPVYFMNYKDGQNALYAYLLVPIFLLFGTSIYAVRSVIAISALVMAIFGAKTVSLFYEDKKLEPVFLFLYAVMPVFTITLRFGLESHLMMGVGSIVIYTLVRAVKKGTVGSYILFGFFSGLILYTYAIAYIVIPIFLLLSLVYLIIKKNINIKKFIATAIPLALLAFPLILEQAVNRYDLPEMQLGPFTVTRMNDYRIGELMTEGFFNKILHSIFSTVLFDDLAYNSIPKFGNFYYISVPFIIIGIGYCFYSLIKSLKKDAKISLFAFPLFYWAAYTLFSGFMLNKPGYTNITRMNGILSSLILFVFIGIKTVIDLIKKEKVRKAAITVTGLCYAALFILFARFYFTAFDQFAYPYKWLFFEPYDDEIFEFLDDPANGYTENDVFLPWLYTYYLWAQKPDPRNLDLFDSIENGSDIYRIGRYRMDSGVDLSSEYVIYKYGYTQESIALFRGLHFNEYETEHFIIFLDPLHDLEFFKENNTLGKAGADQIVLTKSYISYVGGVDIAFYGWVKVPDNPETVRISIMTESGEIEGEILDDSAGEERTICFQFVMDVQEYFGYNEKTFRVEGLDENGKVIYSAEMDMMK